VTRVEEGEVGAKGKGSHEREGGKVPRVDGNGLRLEKGGGSPGGGGGGGGGNTQRECGRERRRGVLNQAQMDERGRPSQGTMAAYPLRAPDWGGWSHWLRQTAETARRDRAPRPLAATHSDRPDWRVVGRHHPRLTRMVGVERRFSSPWIHPNAALPFFRVVSAGGHVQNVAAFENYVKSSSKDNSIKQLQKSYTFASWCIW